MSRISYYLLGDLFKNRVILGYTIFLMLAGWGIFAIESQPEKALLVVMEVTLLALPLVTLVFTTIYYYNSQEFMVLVLSQPVERTTLIYGFFISLGVSFLTGFLIGIGLPLLIFYPTTESLFLILAGGLLSLIFVAIALFISTLMKDKARGMGVTLLLWIFFAFIYDGLLVFLMYQFSDYPIEKGVLILSFLNPIDIARILIIMKTDASALLGLSGAVFRDFFGTLSGAFISFAVLCCWVIGPFLLARNSYVKKDL